MLSFAIGARRSRLPGSQWVERDDSRSRAVRRAWTEGAPMAANPVDDTSVTLMTRLQRSPTDPLAWDEFVERYHPMIRAWCLKWALQESDADDVAQEVLVKLVAAIRKFQFDPARSFRAWLKTVTQHALADFVDARRKDLGRAAGAIDLLAESSDARTDLERQMEDSFDSEVLEMAMQRVKARVKPTIWDAFALTAVEGLSGVAAAQKLQMPVAHVFVAKNRVQKMVRHEAKALKKRLN
jgi:RNA polymerase sigma-70 factor (ECF subfamily)